MKFTKKEQPYAKYSRKRIQEYFIHSHKYILPCLQNQQEFQR